MRVHYQPKVLLPRKWQDRITPRCREAGLAAAIFHFLYKAFSWALSFVCLFCRLLGFVVVCFWVVSVLTSVAWDVHSVQLEELVCTCTLHPSHAECRRRVFSPCMTLSSHGSSIMELGFRVAVVVEFIFQWNLELPILFLKRKSNWYRLISLHHHPLPPFLPVTLHGANLFSGGDSSVPGAQVPVLPSENEEVGKKAHFLELPTGHQFSF